MKNLFPLPQLSMPFWCIGNPIGDPFGSPVMNSKTSIEVCRLLCKAKEEGLIDLASAHDDDLVIWDPFDLEDDLNPNSLTSSVLKCIKKMMDESGLKMVMITCNLHGNPIFRNGGLTNPDPMVRLLAARKVMRTIRIGNFLGAKYLTYWVARDGFECQFAVDWPENFQYLVEGLNLAEKYASECNGSIRFGTIESKPNEPRGEMFLATTGHALSLINSLNNSDFWGVNPELLQHEGMTCLSGANAAGLAIYKKKLFFLHLGNQKSGQFDNDSPLLTGMDGLKEMISIFWILQKTGWEGHLEFDNHMLRTDAAPGVQNSDSLRMDFIRLNVKSIKLAWEKATQIIQNEDFYVSSCKIWEQFPEINGLLSTGDSNAILKYPIYPEDLTKTMESPLKIGQLDHIVNKIILNN